MKTSTYIFRLFQDAVENLNPDYCADILIGEWNDIVYHYTYGESPRRRAYHNLEHVRYMLENYFSIVKPVVNGDQCAWSLMVIAIVYHDFIYHVDSRTNEEDSATCATESLKSLLDTYNDGELITPSVNDIYIERIQKLIMATKHPVTKDVSDMTTSECHIHDLDLLGLSDEKLVDVNNEKVKAEYSVKYTPEEIKDGQKKFFGKLLEGNIFLSPTFVRFEDDARRLIQKHILEQ
jgi:predicted metal-dependent HD superfamily phosphohydrolase